MSDRSQLIDKLVSSKMTREAYVRSKVATSVASQIRALRRRDDMTQQQLAEKSEMKQSRISRVEKPGTPLNTETLVRLSATFGVGLQIRFVSYADMLAWENSFSQDDFDVVRIQKDVAFREGVANHAQYQSTPLSVVKTEYVINTTSPSPVYTLTADGVVLVGNAFGPQMLYRMLPAQRVH